MNNIIFPLKLKTKRLEVGDLQDVLQLLLDHGAILENTEDDRWKLSETLKREREVQ